MLMIARYWIASADNFRAFAAENKFYKPSFAEEDHDPCENTINSLDQKTILNPAFDPVDPSGAVVLTGVGSHRHTDAFHRECEHLADLLTGSLCGNGNTSKQIDRILHDHGSNGGNGIFESHRKSDHTELSDMESGKCKILSPDFNQFDFA